MKVPLQLDVHHSKNESQTIIDFKEDQGSPVVTYGVAALSDDHPDTPRDHEQEYTKTHSKHQSIGEENTNVILAVPEPNLFFDDKLTTIPEDSLPSAKSTAHKSITSPTEKVFQYQNKKTFLFDEEVKDLNVEDDQEEMNLSHRLSSRG